jgi:cytochrome c peroxidase
MYDGGVHHLDFQALNPISHPDEMDLSLPVALAKLRRQLRYQAQFSKAFGDTAITGQRMLKGFSQFLVQLVSANAKYDQVINHTPSITFTAQELDGEALFMTHCNRCHTAPLFTNNSFANNGLTPDPDLQDAGRAGVTHMASDSLLFKVPTLRNVALTPPYMHDGRFSSLSQVLKHYKQGIHQSMTLDKGLTHGLELTPKDQVDLVAFLLTLTDHTFAFNPRFDAP